MGGGGGPPRVNVPEEVIQEAFDNGEDFTLESNEQTNLTKDLTIPAGVVFTVKGVLDLGEANIFTELGQLIVDGGRVQNEASDIVLSGNGTTIFQNQGQLDIDGTLTVNKQVNIKTTTGDGRYEYINVKTLILDKDAEISVTGQGTSDITAAGVRLFFGILQGEGDLNIFIKESMTIEKGGELTLNNNAALNCSKSVVNVEGLLKFDFTSLLRVINGELNVKNGGSIVGLVKEDFLERKNEIVGGVVNVYGEDSESSNISSIENCSFIDVEQINIGKIIDDVVHPGKIFLGKFDSDQGVFTSANQSIEFEDSTTKPMTILSPAGLEYVNKEVERKPPIRFFLGDVEVAFPNGEPEGTVPQLKYPKSENPGFTITYDESGDPGKAATVSRYADINDNVNITEFSIDPNT